IVIVSAAFYVYLWLTRCGINQRTCDKIEEGMTLAQVEAILGVPPGDYRSGPVVLNTQYADIQAFERDTVRANFESGITKADGVYFRYKWWLGDDGYLYVCFSEDGHVVLKELWPGHLESPVLAFFQRLRRWLGL